MRYLNANDMPEHVRNVFETAVASQTTAHITTKYGNAVVISQDEYDRLCAAEQGEYSVSYNYRKFGVEKELEGYLREEIDF